MRVFVSSLGARASFGAPMQDHGIHIVGRPPEDDVTLMS
jgi:hypothetical protein